MDQTQEIPTLIPPPSILPNDDTNANTDNSTTNDSTNEPNKLKQFFHQKYNQALISYHSINQQNELTKLTPLLFLFLVNIYYTQLIDTIMFINIFIQTIRYLCDNKQRDATNLLKFWIIYGSTTTFISALTYFNMWLISSMIQCCKIPLYHQIITNDVVSERIVEFTCKLYRTNRAGIDALLSYGDQQLKLCFSSKFFGANTNIKREY